MSTPTDRGQKSDARDARGRFARGNPGGPGRQPGSKNHATLAAQALLDGEAEALTRKAVELALAGDTAALKLCLERLVPPRRERPVAFGLPQLDGVRDLATATAALLEAVAAGELTPSEAGELAKLVEAHRRVVETVELEARLAAVEARQGSGRR